jgi:hypothetical protein
MKDGGCWGHPGGLMRGVDEIYPMRT